MTTSPGDLQQSTVPRLPARSWLILAVIAAAFLALRVPVMYRQPGGQDEGYFSVPGWTILDEGIPRIPYVPSRNPESVFYKADEALFTLPPAYFYWQAAFYAVLGPGYGTARLASAAAGLVGVGLVYLLGRQFYGDERAALWGAGLYSIARAFYFPCLFARPDMLCTAIGLGAVTCAWHWHRTGRLLALAGAGALVGLGLLTHPFAIVYALQIGAWVLFGNRGWRRRITSSAIFGFAALAVFSCWLPLILAHPEPFRVQFFNNVLDRSGPGLLSRLVFPWQFLALQSRLFLEHAGILQTVLMLAGLLVATVHDLRRDVRKAGPGPVTALVLAWSSIYLLIACQGAHPTKMYWCYPGALTFICVGRAVTLVYGLLSSWWHGSPSRHFVIRGVLSLLLVALMLPGAGLRATLTYLRHWSDLSYNSPRFVRSVLEDLPEEGRFLVDPAYVFDVYLEGRRTILATTNPFYFDASGMPYDYLIAGRYDLERDIPDELDGVYLRSYGQREDLLACYAEVYRFPESPPPRPAASPREP